MNVFYKKYYLMQGLFLISMIFFVLLITTILFVLNIKVSVLNFVLAVLASGVVLYYFSKSIKATLKVTLFGLIIIFCCAIIASHYYDWTWDGNTYHKGMVALLKNGWNPLAETFYDYAQANFPFMTKTYTRTWYDAYPKCAEIWGSVLYFMTQNIETGKSINLISAIALLFICYAFLSETQVLNCWQNICCSFFLVFNPVVLSQLFTYYNDGFLYQMLLLCFIALLYLTFYNKSKYVKICWFLIFVSINIGFNIKFSAIIFLAILCLSFVGYWLYKVFQRDGFTKNTIFYFKNSFLIFSASVLSGTLITGSTSYVINAIRHHNPLYTMIGEDSYEMITSQMPVVFKNMSHIQRFISSLFSVTNTSTKLETVQWKLPLTFNNNEFRSVQSCDVRTAGWGMFFSGILLISLFVILFYIIKKKNIFLKIKQISIILLIALLVSVFVVPGLSWARYNTVIFWIPIAALIYIFIDYNLYKNNKPDMVFVAGIIVALLFINILPGVQLNCSKFKEYDSIQTQLAEFKIITEYNDVVVSVGSYDHYGRIFNLYDNGIKRFGFAEIDTGNCSGKIFNNHPVYYNIVSGIALSNNLVDFLNYLNDYNNYILLIVAKDEASKALTNDVIQKMKSLGLNFDLKNHYRWAYLAVIGENSVIYENLADEQISFNNTIDNVPVSMVSAGYEKGNFASIIINDKEYALNGRGLNIVVYDKVNGNVIDSICVDTYSDNKLTRKLP